MSSPLQKDDARMYDEACKASVNMFKMIKHNLLLQLLNQIEAEKEEAIFGVFRKDAVSVEKIREVFKENGVKLVQPL